MRALSNGDPGGTRTPYLQIRNLSLYPDELRDHVFYMHQFANKLQTVNLSHAKATWEFVTFENAKTNRWQNMQLLPVIALVCKAAPYKRI